MNDHRYNILYRFIACFTEDDAEAKRILDSHYTRILAEASSSTGDLVQAFSGMLKRARDLALQEVKARPFTGTCRTERTSFFAMSEAMTGMHREVFCLHFYKGFPIERIASQLELEVDQAKALLREARNDVASQSLVRLPDIAPDAGDDE